MTAPIAWSSHRECLDEAVFRASITRRRYRVRKDVANGFWYLTELTERVTSSWWAGRCDG